MYDARTRRDVDTQRLNDADRNPADWLTYHGSYKSWHYSGLDQINASNVKDLKIASMHATPRSNRGLQSFALVVDGTLYYTGSRNQLFALDGATGELLWTYKQTQRGPRRQADALRRTTAVSPWATATSTWARSTAGWSPST